MSSKGLSNRIKLSSYDDMFSAENDGNTTAEAKPVEGQIVEIPLSELHTFENHPFRVVDDEASRSMACWFRLSQDREQKADMNLYPATEESMHPNWQVKIPCRLLFVTVIMMKP